MASTDPVRDPKEDEFVRNYILDRCETYQLNPVERAICRTWVYDESSNVALPILGGTALALLLRSRSARLSRAIFCGGLLWGGYAVSREEITRPAIEFPGNNPLFVECITACQQKFPQGQVVTKTKWIHDELFMKDTLVEYPLTQSVAVTELAQITRARAQLRIKTAINSDLSSSLEFWRKYALSNMRSQLMSTNPTTDRITLQKTKEKMKLGT